MKKMRPELINQVAGELLRSNAFLAALQHNRAMEHHRFAPFPLTHARVVPEEELRHVWLQPDKRFSLMTQGVLFGWLYVCFVWLREADRGLFDRLLQDPGFAARWEAFLHEREALWTSPEPKNLKNMMRHFRIAIAHGNLYIEADELLQSRVPDADTRAEFAGLGIAIADL